MKMEKSLPLILKTSGLLTRRELQAYLNIGINEVSAIIERFGLPLRERHVPERSVWSCILKLYPRDQAAADALRVPFKDINWLSRNIGKSTSAIRSKISNGTFQYHHGFQLGSEAGNYAEPRLRRWAPALILPVLSGLPILDFEDGDAVSLASDAGVIHSTGCVETLATDSSDNVFAHLGMMNARSKRHPTE